MGGVGGSGLLTCLQLGAVLEYTGNEAECWSDLVLGAALAARLQKGGGPGPVREEVSLDSSYFLIVSLYLRAITRFLALTHLQPS